jgi:uncharacterized phage protein gp47/JayE
MAFTFKEKDQMVTDIITRLQPLLPANTDFSSGTPLRNILESMMEEVDIQYWQLEQVYNSGHIDDAVDDDLDKLVAVLGVKRNPALPSLGLVTFARSTPADNDYVIPEGTQVETLPDTQGNTIKFSTVGNFTLLTGQIQIDANVQCITPGITGNIPALTIKTINNPPLGIESVQNTQAMDGGTDIESNDALRDRTKHILDTSGLGTVDALLYKIKLTPSVKEVTVRDMARGIGTVDILVLTDVVPMTDTKKIELQNIIAATKAGGIDVALVEPVLISANIDVILTLASGYVVGDVLTGVNNAIINYVNLLEIGQSLIVNQLNKVILNSSPNIIDVKINTPAENIAIDIVDIIRTGTITIN